MGDAPYVFSKKRDVLTGAMKKSVTIARFWKHKETGTVVEVLNLQEVDGSWYRVIFRDEKVPGLQLSMPFKSRPNPFQPPGAPEVLMEPGFTDQYEMYENQRSVR